MSLHLACHVAAGAKYKLRHQAVSSVGPAFMPAARLTQRNSHTCAGLFASTPHRPVDDTSSLIFACTTACPHDSQPSPSGGTQNNNNLLQHASTTADKVCGHKPDTHTHTHGLLYSTSATIILHDSHINLMPPRRPSTTNNQPSPAPQPAKSTRHHHTNTCLAVGMQPHDIAGYSPVIDGASMHFAPGKETSCCS